MFIRGTYIFFQLCFFIVQFKQQIEYAWYFWQNIISIIEIIYTLKCMYEDNIPLF